MRVQPRGPQGAFKQEEALSSPQLSALRQGDRSDVGGGFAPLNALAQATAEAEGRSRTEDGQGARDRVENFHTDRVAGVGKGPGAERSRRSCESQTCQR